MEYKFTKPNLLEIVIIITLIFVIVWGWNYITTVSKWIDIYVNQTRGLPVMEWNIALTSMFFISIIQFISLIVLLKIAAILEGIRKKL